MSDLLATMTWDIDPTLVKLGPLQLRYYGILFALALAAGYYVFRDQFRYENEDPENASGITYALVAAIIVGARLGHVFFYDAERFLADPIEIVKVWHGGLASHGATIGILITCIIYSYVYRKEPARVLLDRMAMTIPIAAICVRLGNFMNSEIVGSPTDVPWAVIFPRHDMIPRHPSQLYEVGMGIILVVIMFSVQHYYRKNRRQRPLGLNTGLILTGYFTMRFLVEYFKEYQVEEMIGGLRMGQVLSIPFIIIGLTVLYASLFGAWKNQYAVQYNTRFQLPKSEGQ